jgi:ABC-2 type transport system ATP-binding protein
MIEVRGVFKSFGRVHAVRGVTFDAPAHRVVGLLGPNGAGKTTTIRMITGFTPPDAGRVTVAGFDIVEQSRSARRALGYLPESAPAYGEMRTIDYLHFRARLYGLDRARRSAAADRVIEQCWLADVRTRRIGHLSKGYRQRVGLAAAMIHDPSVLILDEPTNGLDPRQIREAWQLVRSLAASRTVLVSSHILPEIEQMCDRVVIMSRGQVRAEGTPAELVSAQGGQGAIIVESQTAPAGGVEATARLLSAVRGVASAQRLDPPGPPPADGFSRFELTTAPGSGDPRARVAEAMRSAGILVRELRPRTATLEQVFLKIMETDAGPPTPASAPKPDEDRA